MGPVVTPHVYTERDTVSRKLSGYEPAANKPDDLYGRSPEAGGAWAPGGNTIQVKVVTDIPLTELITIEITNKKEHKTWTSAPIPPTQSFMNVNESRP